MIKIKNKFSALDKEQVDKNKNPKIKILLDTFDEIQKTSNFPLEVNADSFELLFWLPLLYKQRSTLRFEIFDQQ